MEAKVKNVRLIELIALLANLHLKYDVVDIILEPDKQRVVIDPVDENDMTSRVTENPNKISLEGEDLEDII